MEPKTMTMPITGNMRGETSKFDDFLSEKGGANCRGNLLDVEKVHPWLFQQRLVRSEFGQASQIARLSSLAIWQSIPGLLSRLFIQQPAKCAPKICVRGRICPCPPQRRVFPWTYGRILWKRRSF